MIPILPVHFLDGYKCGHPQQLEHDTEETYSNFTPRSGRDPSWKHGAITFGCQYFLQEYLIRQYNENFFQRPREEVLREYKRRMDYYLGPDAVPVHRIGELHEYGKIPLRIKALPEGTLVPYGVPMFTFRNTQKPFAWFTNNIETIMSATVWKMCTSATTALQFRLTFEKYARRTVSDGGDPFVEWQGHDFSFRGQDGLESACKSGAAHLLSFHGTDTVPAIDFLEEYYGADVEKEIVGGSVSATEHMVMCMGTQDGEADTYRRLLTEVQPSGVISIVSDTWDYWNVLTNIVPALKDVILARPGKAVFRPDSGVPEKIINGDPSAAHGTPESKGSIRVLDEIFGHTLTPNGYKLLDSHVGLIYGDSIDRQRQEVILGGLAANGYASTNVVLGLGSFCYQFVTRDTHGMAMKCTFGRTTRRGDISIFKRPKTDDGGKFSACGLLRVDRVNGELELRQDVTREEEEGGELGLVFDESRMARTQLYGEVRGVVMGEMEKLLALEAERAA